MELASALKWHDILNQEIYRRLNLHVCLCKRWEVLYRFFFKRRKACTTREKLQRLKNTWDNDTKKKLKIIYKLKTTYLHRKIFCGKRKKQNKTILLHVLLSHQKHSIKLIFIPKLLDFWIYIKFIFLLVAFSYFTWCHVVRETPFPGLLG